MKQQKYMAESSSTLRFAFSKCDIGRKPSKENNQRCTRDAKSHQWTHRVEWKVGEHSENVRAGAEL
jgi:hypothetical protein